MCKEMKIINSVFMDEMKLCSKKGSAKHPKFQNILV